MLIFFCFAVFAGILAGLIPAVLLSRLQTIQILKNLSGLKIFNVALLNRVLTITQFAVSGIVMIVLFTMFRQSRYMENGNYGFDPRGIINIPVAQSLPYEGLASELSSIPGVQRISAISSNFGYHPADYCKVTREGEPLQMETACYFIDENVIANFNLHLLAGEDFWKDAPASQQNRIIINEESARMLGFKDPGTAVGNTVRVDDSLKLIITGVVRDFHFENFKHLITPLIFRYDRSRVRYLNLKTDPLKFAAIAAAIRNKFIQLGLEPPAGIAGMDSRLRGEQAHAGDVMFVLYISVMLLATSCLGILGMSAYMSETRTKEISIRKLLGADMKSIVFVLCKEFFLLLSVSLLIGIPVGIFAGKSFLNNFAYKVPMGIVPVLSAALLIIVVGLSAFGSQIGKAVFVSPVKRLRME
jgi:putative ABC transport system permease protein